MPPPKSIYLNNLEEKEKTMPSYILELQYENITEPLYFVGFNSDYGIVEATHEKSEARRYECIHVASMAMKNILEIEKLIEIVTIHKAP